MLFPYLYVSYSSFLSKDVLEYTFQPAVATILMGENCPISHCAVLPSVQPSVCYNFAVQYRCAVNFKAERKSLLPCRD